MKVAISGGTACHAPSGVVINDRAAEGDISCWGYLMRHAGRSSRTMLLGVCLQGRLRPGNGI